MIQKEKTRRGNKCYLKVAVVMMIWLPRLTLAFGDFFVSNSTLIYDVCESRCGRYSQKQAEHLKSDCDRGCRMFDIQSKNSAIAHFDDINKVHLQNCHDSCFEAYQDNILEKTACSDGCSISQQEYNEVYQLSLQWFREVKNNMTLLEKLLDLTSAIMFPAPSPLNVDASLFVEKVPSRNTDNHRLQVKKDSPSVVPPSAEELDYEVIKKSPAFLPKSVYISAFTLFALGISSIALLCCYCCAFAHNPNKKLKVTVSKLDTDLPPSYEQLLREGFVIRTSTLLQEVGQ